MKQQKDMLKIGGLTLRKEQKKLITNNYLTFNQKQYKRVRCNK